MPKSAAIPEAVSSSLLRGIPDMAGLPILSRSSLVFVFANGFVEFWLEHEDRYFGHVAEVPWLSYLVSVVTDPLSKASMRSSRNFMFASLVANAFSRFDFSSVFFLRTLSALS